MERARGFIFPASTTNGQPSPSTPEHDDLPSLIPDRGREMSPTSMFRTVKDRAYARSQTFDADVIGPLRQDFIRKRYEWEEAEVGDDISAEVRAKIKAEHDEAKVQMNAALGKQHRLGEVEVAARRHKKRKQDGVGAVLSEYAHSPADRFFKMEHELEE